MSAIDLERVQFVLEEKEPLLVAGTPHEVRMNVNDVFVRLSYGLTDEIKEDVLNPLTEFLRTEDPEAREEALERDFQELKTELSFLAQATRREKLRAFAGRITGMFVAFDLNHNPKNFLHYPKILWSEMRRYKQYGQMNDEELKEALRPTLEDDRTLNGIFYRQAVEGAVHTILRHAGRHPEAFPVTGEDMSQIIAEDAIMDRRDKKSERSIYGLSIEANDLLSRLVVGSLVDKHLLEEGRSFVWQHPDNELVPRHLEDSDESENFDWSDQEAVRRLKADRAAYYAVPRYKLRQFVLRTAMA